MALAIEVQYRQRLAQLLRGDYVARTDNFVTDSYSLYSILSYSTQTKSILATPESPQANDLLKVVKFYLQYFPDSRQEKWGKYMLASYLVELGYIDDVLLANLEPWFGIFFKLKKTNVNILQLQSVFTQAGFPVFDEASQKVLVARIAEPEKDIYFSAQRNIVNAFFGKCLTTISVREPNENEVADFVAASLNSIQPSLNIDNANEIWNDDELQDLILQPVAASLLGYEIEIPENKTVFCHFEYDKQGYGFFTSDGLMDSMFNVMLNIDCFLSFIGRPERIFFLEHDGTEGEIESYVLAEPQAMHALAKKLQLPIFNTADVLKIWQDDIDRAGCYAPTPSLCKIDWESNVKDDTGAQVESVLATGKKNKPNAEPWQGEEQSAQTEILGDTEGGIAHAGFNRRLGPLGHLVTILGPLIIVSFIICMLVLLSMAFGKVFFNADVGIKELLLYPSILLAVLSVTAHFYPNLKGYIRPTKLSFFIVLAFFFIVSSLRSCNTGSQSDANLSSRQAAQSATMAQSKQNNASIKSTSRVTAKPAAELRKYTDEEIKQEAIEEERKQPHPNVRCSAPDNSYSYRKRKVGACDEGDIETIESVVKPKIPPWYTAYKGRVICVAKDGSKTIQDDDCASPDDVRYPL